MTDYSALARSYNTLDYAPKLRRTLSAFFQQDLFDDLSKFELHQKISEILMKHYHGEEVLKYRLAKFYARKNYVAAFEVNVQRSRADFLVINGETKCFEIKSRIDTLDRLEKQVGDYKDVFEYNTVVVDQKHLDAILNLLPEYYGIWAFQKSRRKVIRKAELSPELDPWAQLSMLTKKELMRLFGSDCRTHIMANFGCHEVNQQFKLGLKSRYFNRWKFVTENWDQIQPMDLQFFFHSNILPRIVYQS